MQDQDQKDQDALRISRRSLVKAGAAVGRQRRLPRR